MKSPFPGMDPFLELHWLDMHPRLIGYICDELQDWLPADLLARIGERVVLEFEGLNEFERPSGKHPDVLVSETPRGNSAASTLPTAIRELAQPTGVVTEEAELPETETYIEIVDAATGSQVISVIELISPTNKIAGKGRDSYLQKTSSYLQAGVNLIEIDLTRNGDRTAIMPWIHELPEEESAYLAGVYRFINRGERRLEYHQLHMDRPLKPIGIPLRPGDDDVVLQLQPLLERAYQKGRYERLDYRQKLTPPLSSAELALLERGLSQRVIS